MPKRPVHATLEPIASEAFVALLRVSARLLTDLGAACGEFGITHDQYNVLRILRGVHPQGHPRYEVASRLVSRAPDVTRLLDRLVARGLVKRSWDADNRRLSIASITTEGLALLDEVDPRMDEVARQYVGPLSESEWRSLLRLCQRMQH